MCLRNVLKKFGHYFKKFLKYDNTKEQKKIFGYKTLNHSKFINENKLSICMFLIKGKVIFINKIIRIFLFKFDKKICSDF